MNSVVERRLALWPNSETRAEAARLLYVEGWELGAVLARFPDEVVAEDRGRRHGAARRAIWAHYALLQEAIGEPDVDPADRESVQRIISAEGIEVARCRTGSPLHDTFPDLGWYQRQAPASWPIQAGSKTRQESVSRSAMCPECFCIHAGDCQ